MKNHWRQSDVLQESGNGIAGSVSWPWTMKTLSDSGKMSFPGEKPPLKTYVL